MRRLRKLQSRYLRLIRLVGEEVKYETLAAKQEKAEADAAAAEKSRMHRLRCTGTGAATGTGSKAGSEDTEQRQ